MNKDKIYLIPGLMNNNKLWSKIAPFLDKEYKLVYLSIPLTLNFDEAIKELDENIRDEKINLLGFSLGAYLASYYATKRKNKIDRLFLVAGTPSSLSNKEIKAREIFLKQIDNLNLKTISIKKIKHLLENKNKNNIDLIEHIKDMFDSFTLEEYKLQLSTTFKRKDIYKELLSTNIPINFLFKKNDRLLNYSSMKVIDRSYKNVVIKSLEGYGHMIPLEEPSILVNEIKNWMDREI